MPNNFRGHRNSALGVGALADNRSGNDNTAVAFQALSLNKADRNTAIGFQALHNNVFTTENTAVGYNALFNNMGSFNTAVGNQALVVNTGTANTAIGNLALRDNTDGGLNTATGSGALQLNTTGSFNTANGWGTLFNNSTGNENTAIGQFALTSNTTGNNNTAIGSAALQLNTAGDNNIALGFHAGENLTTGSNNIDIGNAGRAGESSTIRIGVTAIHQATYIAGISEATVPTGVAVIVDGSGHLGTTTSSERFKESIKPMDHASEAILALQPVTFRYKHELDPDGIPQFGLVAEQVEEINRDLVARDEQRKPYSVRYEAVNAMLLNEFLKEHRTVEELKREIAALTATVNEQAVQIQSVSAQLQMSKPTPQMVLDQDHWRLP
jgi:trimeric autotransporter adhesin